MTRGYFHLSTSLLAAVFIKPYRVKRGYFHLSTSLLAAVFVKSYR